MTQGGTSKRRWWYVGLGPVVLGLWAAAGWAQPRGSHGMRLLRAVGLMDDQKTQIKAIVAAHRPTLRTLHSQLRTANQALSDAMLATGDPTPIVQQITQLRGQLLAEAVKMRQEVLGVLTPDQLVKAAQLTDQLRALQAQRHTLLTGGTPGTP
jgi:hypothetical protein